MGIDKPTYTYFPPRASPWVPHMVGWKYPVHPDTPTLIGWVVWCTGKSSVRKVTHPSTNLALGCSTSKFPWDWGQGLGFKPLFISREIYIMKVQSFSPTLSHLLNLATAWDLSYTYRPSLAIRVLEQLIQTNILFVSNGQLFSPSWNQIIMILVSQPKFERVWRKFTWGVVKSPH